MSKSAFALDPGKISNRQFMFIIIVSIISVADLFLPSVVAAIAGRDAWLSVLVAAVETLVLAIILIKLGQRFSDKTLVDISKLVLGHWLGWIIAFGWITLYSIYTLIISLGQLAIIIKSSFMEFTPLWVFTVTLVVTAAYAVNQGIETIARVTELLLPLGIGLLVLVGLLVLPYVNFDYYLPVLEFGWAPVINGSFRLWAFLGDAVLLLMIMPYLNQPERAMSTVLKATGMLVCFLMIGVFAIGMFNARETAAMAFPALEMVRRIQIGTFIHHLDAVIMAIWIAGVYVKIVVYYYISCIGYAQLFGIESYRSLIVPLGALVVIWNSAWVYSAVDTVRYISDGWPAHALVFQLLVPALLLLGAVTRGLKSEKSKTN